jgi:hypothetical protein
MVLQGVSTSFRLGGGRALKRHRILGEADHGLKAVAMCREHAGEDAGEGACVPVISLREICRSGGLVCVIAFV